MSESGEDDAEHQFTPSMWSKRFASRFEVLTHHLKFVTEASHNATQNIPNQCDIPYGTRPGQKLDIFGTDLADDALILVYIHGGFWQELSRPQSRYAVEPLYRSKVKTVVVGYDLCPVVSLPEIVEEILAAAKYVFDYARKIGSRGVYFAGHSAGAHLIAKMLANAEFFKQVNCSRLLRGAFLISGIFDLRGIVDTTVNDSLCLSEKEAKEMSPLLDSYFHLCETNLRLYILAGQYDSFTFRKQSRDFYEMFLSICPVQNMHFEIKDNMDHFDIVESFTKDDNFLKNLLLHDSRKYL